MLLIDDDATLLNGEPGRGLRDLESDSTSNVLPGCPEQLDDVPSRCLCQGPMGLLAISFCPHVVVQRFSYLWGIDEKLPSVQARPSPSCVERWVCILTEAMVER
jgi:hypothetical protein